MFESYKEEEENKPKREEAVKEITVASDVPCSILSDFVNDFISENSISSLEKLYEMEFSGSPKEVAVLSNLCFFRSRV